MTVLCRFGPMRAQAFEPARVQGVYFLGAQGRSAKVGAGGQKSRAMMIVPFAQAGGYVAPEVWEQMASDERSGHYTFRPGDALVPGGAVPQNGESAAAFLARTPHWVIAQVTEYPHGRLAHFEVLCGEKGASV